MPFRGFTSQQSARRVACSIPPAAYPWHEGSDPSSGLRSKLEPSRLLTRLPQWLSCLVSPWSIRSPPIPSQAALHACLHRRRVWPEDQPRPDLRMLWVQTPHRRWHKHPAAVTMATLPLPAFLLLWVKPSEHSHYIFARKLQIQNNHWRKHDLLIYSREKHHLQTSRSEMSTYSRNAKSIRNKKNEEVY